MNWLQRLFGTNAGQVGYGGYQDPAMPEPVKTLLTDNRFFCREPAAESLHGEGLLPAIQMVVPYLAARYPWERDAAQAALQTIRASLSDEEAARLILPGQETRKVEYFCPHCEQTTVVHISPFSEFRCSTCSPAWGKSCNVASATWNDRMEALAEKELDAESERMARRLADLQNDMNRCGNRASQEVVAKSIKAIGEELGKRGGFFRMLAVCHRVRTLSGTHRLVERIWDGTCGWQG